MKPKRLKGLRFPAPSPADPGLSIKNPKAAGIDIHSREHFVAVPLDCIPKKKPAAEADPSAAPSKEPGVVEGLPPNVRRFETYTGDLEKMADWLQECGITTVAMESTGVYWIPGFELLERRGFTVHLIDPRQTRHVPGRPKSDVLDCQWIQKLHAFGLLSASFRPSDAILPLRSYLRHRSMLVRYQGSHVQHVQKALEQMNVKLAEVVSDITGVTGMAIIRAILAGERNASVLAKWRNEKCKKSEAEIARALLGNWRDDHLFELKQAVELYDVHLTKIVECDRVIEAYLAKLDDRSGGKKSIPKKPRRGRKRTEAKYDVRGSLYRVGGVDLTQIEGIDEATALVIISEIGRDMSKFPSEKHFTSWLGLSPVHQGSAGRIKSRKVRRGANPAARALRLAAQGCHHAKNAMGAFYRRVQARKGGSIAVVATARKIAERVYRMLKYGEEYVRLAAEEYEQKYRQRRLYQMTKELKALGLEVVLANPSRLVKTP